MSVDKNKDQTFFLHEVCNICLQFLFYNIKFGNKSEIFIIDFLDLLILALTKAQQQHIFIYCTGK